MQKPELKTPNLRIAAVLFLGTLLAFVAAPAAAQTVLVHAGRVLTDAHSATGGPATIVVVDGRIAEIADGYRPAGEGESAIDLSDKTVMPGLIDLHTHLTGNVGADFRDMVTIWTDEETTLRSMRNAGRTVRAGVTTARDLGSRSPEILNAVREATADNMFPGPRVLNAGKVISIVGGNGDSARSFRPELHDALSGDHTCTGATECARSVRLAWRSGADLIKLKITAGSRSARTGPLSASQFTDEELTSIADTAHALGLKVTAHAHGARAIEQAARAGIDSIEHGTFMDEDAARAMRDNGTILVPTLQAMKEELVRAGNSEAETEAMGRGLIALALEFDIPVAFGTDSGAVVLHGDNAVELDILHEYGLSNRDAIAGATTIAARAAGMEDSIGRLAPGYSADIIAVAGDPLADLNALDQVDWVMVRGRVIE